MVLEDSALEKEHQRLLQEAGMVSLYSKDVVKAQCFGMLLVQ